MNLVNNSPAKKSSEMTDPVQSPCINVCRLMPDESVCAGCYRTLAEIEAWSRLTETERLRVVTAARERLANRGASPP
ncbi:MAG TPA: DUF1289 domain-containing protein [Candidatus Methylacidiphilales bacterium]|nr:DUF1289 domain-containing protein [Candidatus Methylacidiphilales bacterium]